MKIKIKQIFPVFLTLFAFIFASVTVKPIHASRTDDFSMQEAKRLEAMLKRLAKRKRKAVFLKKVTFSQDELNSYLNLIYIKRYTPEVKYVKLKLEKNNYVSGTIKVKLEGKKYDNVPGFLKDIEVETSGRVECKNYRMRFLFEDIKVNGNSFSPEILDEGFGAAQSGFKVKKSLYDWFQLLPGIKSITIDHKKITLFY
jgi:hypothetical protein